jgi:phospholipid transport system substrate-binding protein
MYRLFLKGFFLLIFMLAYAAPSPSEERGPSQVIEQLNGVLLEVMKNAKRLGYQGRYDKLAPVVKRTHDLAFLAKFSLGGYWNKLSAEQQSQWGEKFSDYSIATYAGRFDGYSGEAFKVVSEEPWKRGKMVVKSMLIRPDEDDIELEYILSQGDSGQWRIINVLVDGVSDLALKRAEYSNILSKEGFDALLNKLSEKISDYAEGKSQ